MAAVLGALVGALLVGDEVKGLLEVSASLVGAPALGEPLETVEAGLLQYPRHLFAFQLKFKESLTDFEGAAESPPSP